MNNQAPISILSRIKPQAISSSRLNSPEKGVGDASALMLDPSVPNALDLRVLTALRKIIRSVDLYSRELKNKSEVTAPQLICLLAIVKNGPMSATSVSREVFLSPSTIVGILDRLEIKGLVKRERSQKDRRIVMVSATPLGTTLVARAPSPIQDILKRRLQELPVGEQEDITRSLERVVELMEADHVEAAPILELGPIPQKTTQEDKGPQEF